MANTDIEILKNAQAFEARNGIRAWEASNVGASRQDINRLLGAELIECRSHSCKVGPNQYGPALYKLTQKGWEATFIIPERRQDAKTAILHNLRK